MCHVTKYSTIRGVFRGGYNGSPNRHLESGVDPGNEVDRMLKVWSYCVKVRRNLEWNETSEREPSGKPSGAQILGTVWTTGTPSSV